MEQTVQVPDGLASEINAFAAEHDVPVDRAYELLLNVGLKTLDGVRLDLYVEDGRLILECPACSAVFEDAADALEHDHEDH